jgi:hypothetical protein
MIRHEVKYRDIDDKPVSKVLYFNLSKADLIELNLEWEHPKYESIEEYFKQTVDDKNVKELLKIIKLLVEKAYGRRDGQDFVKDPVEAAKFMVSQAYAEMFANLAMDPEVAEKFMTNLLPSDLLEQAKTMTVDIPVEMPKPIVTEQLTLPKTDEAIPEAFRRRAQRTVGAPPSIEELEAQLAALRAQQPTP